MKKQGLLDFIKILEENNEIFRINTPVNPELEISEITDRISKSKRYGSGGKALFFENNGTRFPLLINAFGSLKRMCLVLGVESLDEVREEINNLFSELTKPKTGFFSKVSMLPRLSDLSKQIFPDVIKGKGACQENIHMQPDLGILPVLKCWPADGGKFITLPLVITKDPNTGIRNIGMYRMQVIDKNTTGMHWHLHKVGARHYQEYKKLGKKMPVSVVLGGDPIYTYCATAPMPDQMDEFMLAGFIKKQQVKLVKCITNDLEVPADADIVIEGYVDPEEDLFFEGPFGDHTGFYSLADYYPKFYVTAITYRNNAVYPATIVGIPPQEDAWIGKATERIFLEPIKKTLLPEIEDLCMPFEGVVHNLTIISIDKTYKGQVQKSMNSLWGAGQLMFNKVLVVCGNEVNIQNSEELIHVLLNNLNPQKDLIFSEGPLDVLDHAADEMAYGSKLCIDLTNQRNRSYCLPSGEEIQDILNNSGFEGELFNGLIDKGISGFVLACDHGSDLSETEIKNLLKSIENIDVLFVIVVNKGLNFDDLSTLLWLVLGNIDPIRDIYFGENKKQLLIDATIKTRKKNNFKRNWPNIVAHNNQTINKVDKDWAEYNMGEPIESPSKSIYNYIKGNDATYKPDEF
ncbi:MAG: menaquinone biosynthesis decarboxylase [Marinilabiliales bacterium]|nr:MAG: menaquinone biosynthesis decarboxylase [Marinilabiliales bacterium]